jgi:hypothetical protein
MLADHPTIALDPIPGYPGYLACRLGVIFSLNNRSRKLRGTPTPLSHEVSYNGYLRVVIYVNRKRIKKLVHHLILETYIGPRPEGMECCHGPGGQSDNSIGNLRWGTKQENTNDVIAAGSQRGENNASSRLSPIDIPIIRAMRPVDAARKYGIRREYAWQIKNRLAWKHIP